MNNQMFAAMMQNNMMNMMQLNNNQSATMSQMANMVNNMNAQMNNNLANLNSGQNSNPQSQQNNGGLTINFRTSGEGLEKKIVVQCTPDEKVSEIIQKYRAKSNDKDNTKKFIYNAKQLNQDLTAAEAGIMNNSNIFVVATKGIKGAK